MANLWKRILPSAAKTSKPSPARKVVGARNEYQGASFGRRTNGWNRNGLDPNAELNPTVIMALRGIARDMVRNNPYAANGATKIAQYLVGPGIRLQVFKNGEHDKYLTALARGHLESTACDSEGRHSLYGLQLQAVHTMITSGEVLIRRRWRRKSDRLDLPFVLQVLEPDWINMSLSQAQPDGGMRLQGIDIDPIGRRKGYWLYERHPGSVLATGLDTKLIDAKDVAHIFKADRPGALHGATWFSPVITRLMDFGEYEDAQLVRQKIAACFTVFRIGDPEGDIQPTHDSNGNPLENLQSNSFTLEPGIIEDLPAGSDVKFADPPGVDGYEPYSRVSRQAIAAGLHIPYEVLTGDNSNVSFISGRLGRLDFKQSIETWQQSILIPQLCEPIGRWLIEAMQMSGIDTSGVTVRWTPPRFAMMSPETEIPAIRDAIRSGQQTISGAARERGEDPNEFLEEWAHDAKHLDALGLIFDSDPRHVTAVGNPVAITPDQMNAKGKNNG